jgi:hypothetical protein
MNGGRFFNDGRAESTPWPWPVEVAAPSLIVCPIPSAATPGTSPAAAQEIYRLAYERALAAARPGRYELALGAPRN